MYERLAAASVYIGGRISRCTTLSLSLLNPRGLRALARSFTIGSIFPLPPLQLDLRYAKEKLLIVRERASYLSNTSLFMPSSPLFFFSFTGGEGENNKSEAQRARRRNGALVNIQSTGAIQPRFAPEVHVCVCLCVTRACVSTVQESQYA